MKRRVFVPVALLLAVAASGVPLSAQVVDVTASYADSSTARLVRLASARHQGRGMELDGYRANLFTRVEGRVASNRFARGLLFMSYETAARLRWYQYGDVEVDVLGVRTSTVRLPGIRRERWAAWWTEVFADEPWFSPSALGDEIQLMGIPDQEAIHPLARGAERFYRFAISDSMTMSLPGRVVRAVAVNVEPREFATRRGRESDRGRPWEKRFSDDEPTLVSGQLWLDADSLDVVRMMVTFIGEGIWDDDPDAPELVTLEADLEYGLHLNRYWLPHRQILAATFKYKYLPGAAMPATAVTTFSDFEIFADSTISFDRGTQLISRRRRADWDCAEPWEWDDTFESDCGERGFTVVNRADDGSRWEVSVPPLDSLQAYAFDAEFEQTVDLAAEEFIATRVGDLATLSERLPDDVVGRDRFGVDWQQAMRVFQFNRVQGASLGLGYQWRPGPGFTTLHLDGRFGFGDLRPMAAVTWRRDGPVGRFDLEAFRSVRPVESWTPVGIGASMKALILGHDDADYYLALGGGISFSGYQGALRDGTFSLRFERQGTLSQVSGSTLNDVFFGSGSFPPNPSIVEGDFLRGSLSRRVYAGPLWFEAGLEGLYGGADRAGARFWGAARATVASPSLIGSLGVRGGTVAGDSLPQLQYRVGGPATVRGYSYGTRRGDALWSAQADAEWVVSQWWSPVAFVDVGGTDSFRDPLVGLGVGASLLSGWMRVEFAKGVNPSTDIRVDVLFQMPVN